MSLEFFESSETTSALKEVTESVQNLESGVELEQTELLSLQEQAEGTDLVAGNPETDEVNWHKQSEMNSCAICCQEFVAEQLLDTEFSEEQFRSFAMENGWYNPEIGTPGSDVGSILEALGLEVERENGVTLADLYSDLESGGKVICGVNSLILDDAAYAEIPGLNADHVVEVIGIDQTNPSDVKIILNDSGVSGGQGREVSMEAFIKAWNTSNRFTVTARKGSEA